VTEYEVVRFPRLIRLNEKLYRFTRGRACLHPVRVRLCAPGICYEVCKTCGINMEYAYRLPLFILAVVSAVLLAVFLP